MQEYLLDIFQNILHGIAEKVDVLLVVLKIFQYFCSGKLTQGLGRDLAWPEQLHKHL